jgi:two-component system, OmpR family, KDP operon response regulator KdpE
LVDEESDMSEKTRVLVVDDERPIRRFLNASLSGEYMVLEASSGEEALAVSVSGRPDVIILDLGLPDMDGVEVTRRLREWNQTPIIVVSVRDREEDKIAALDAGADDYLTKPFGVGELLARLRVILRRNAIPGNEPVFHADRLTVDLTRHEVMVEGKTTSLTPTEYDILRILIRHAGKVLTHQQLIHQVWGDPNEADAHLLRVNISNLRRKIEADPSRPRCIMTEPGIGYRLKDFDTAGY